MSANTVLRLTALAALGVGLSAPAAASTLRGLYTFENAGGNFANVVDDSGNGKNPLLPIPTAAPALSLQSGVNGGTAASFNPTSPNAPNNGFEVDIEISPSPSNQFTIGGWLYMTDDPDDWRDLRTFFSNDNGGYDRGLWYNQGAGQWQIMGGYPQNTGVYMSLNAGHWVTVTFGGPAGTNAQLYLDGLLRWSGISGENPGSDPHLRFGAYDDSYTTESWSGYMDNLFVFDGVLNSTQIQDIHTRGLTAIREIGGLNNNANTVPAPGTLAMLGLGLAGLSLSRRTRR